MNGIPYRIFFVGKYIVMLRFSLPWKRGYWKHRRPFGIYRLCAWDNDFDYWFDLGVISFTLWITREDKLGNDE